MMRPCPDWHVIVSSKPPRQKPIAKKPPSRPHPTFGRCRSPPIVGPTAIVQAEQSSNRRSWDAVTAELRPLIPLVFLSPLAIDLVPGRIHRACVRGSLFATRSGSISMYWVGSCRGLPVQLHETFPLRCRTIRSKAAISPHRHRVSTLGYPHGLFGEQIGLESRIVAIADKFDAMTTARPYKEAFPEEEALQILRSQIGKQFDPKVHAAFVRALPEIRLVRKRLSDDDDLPAPAKEAVWEELELVGR